jgi:hypothetical protein
VAAGAAVVAQREPYLRPRERDAPEHLVAVAELGRLALQELAPRRRVEIKILHRDRGAGPACRGLDLAEPRALGADHAGMIIGPGARGDGNARYGGDRSERLAAKAHRRHRLEVFELRDLARGMAREREAQVVARDAVAVVLHLDAPHAAFVERHADAACVRIEAVLEQLLQHRCRALDHFPRRYLAHEQIGKDANGRHGPSI